MRTEVLSDTDINIQKAAGIIKAGGLAAFPTETVYGLGANALDGAAVEKIFLAKGRPNDNPLIVHVADIEGVCFVAGDIPAAVTKLMKTLGGAPLTYVLKKKPCVPYAVTAGLDTVAVRIPAHGTALKLIRAAGVPVAAPSANRSGRPSPTTARHVFDDLSGRIPIIIDGGATAFGVESTVVDFTGEQAVILRPGGFSRERLEELMGQKVYYLKKTDKNEGGAQRSPGLKYKHYSPSCKIAVVRNDGGIQENLINLYDFYVQNKCRPVIICQTGYLQALGGRTSASLGGSAEEAARSLFRIFRELEGSHGVMICHLLPDEGIGRAFNDRLLRAASNGPDTPPRSDEK